MFNRDEIMPIIYRRFLLYVVKRIIVFLIILFVSFSVVFFFMHLIPGDPITRFVIAMEQRWGYSPLSLSYVDQYKKAFGLEGTLLEQYERYLDRVFLHFDLGPSFVAFPTPSQDLVIRALPWSIILLGLSSIISWTIGVLVGTLVGWKKGSKIDAALFTLALGISQIPAYLLMLFTILLFAYIIPIFPSRWAFSPNVVPGFNLDFIISIIQHAALPALTVVVVQFSFWLINTRAMTVTILGEDFLMFAQAKGLKTSRLLTRYVLRNTLLPQVTGLATNLGFTVNGFYLVEFLFNYPGIGGLLYNAVYTQDYNTVQAIVLISILTVLMANLLVDLLLPLIDPRIRSG
jgi:peptide/nickel transport system permease protein